MSARVTGRWVIQQVATGKFVVAVEDDGNKVTWGEAADAVTFPTRKAATEVAVGRGGVQVRRADAA